MQEMMVRVRVAAVPLINLYLRARWMQTLVAPHLCRGGVGGWGGMIRLLVCSCAVIALEPRNLGC